MQLADIWSCGIILYAILFGRYPFNAQDRDYARKIVNADYEVPADVPVNPECVDLLLRILVADPPSACPSRTSRCTPGSCATCPGAPST